MKKMFVLLLCLLLIASMAACSKEVPTETTAAPAQPVQPLQVGFGRAVITPQEPMILDGFFDKENRVSENVLDDLYATCTAFTDAQGNTVLLFHMDLLSSNAWASVTRKAVSDKTGISVDHIMVACTHTHSGPDVRSGYETEGRYVEFLKERMTQAAQAALADRKSAEMYISSTQITNMNFIRHYVMNDGSIVGDNFGTTTGKTYAGHLTQADNTMQLICFKRQGGKDVVMVNWQGHPTRTGGTMVTDISADIVGSMRSYVEEQLDCNFTYFSGASGNVNSHSRIASENIASNYLSQGRYLGKHAIMALENLTRVKTGRVQILGKDLKIQAISSTYAFSVGDVAFVTAPYEMFDANGRFIKENSPFTMTFVATNANECYHYIASDPTFEYDAYEISNGCQVRGVAEALADGYVEMLKEIHKTRYFEAGVTELEIPVSDSALYWNLDKGTSRKAGADGTYTVNFLKNGQVTALKVADSNLLARIDTQYVMGLALEGDKVTGVVKLTDMPYGRLTWDYTVRSISGNTVKTNSEKDRDGTEVTLELGASVKVYDVSAYAKTPGILTELQPQDVITAVADTTGKPAAIFVTSRIPSAEQDPTPRYCAHCKKDVTWLRWLSKNSLPTESGHYYLAENVTLTQSVTLSNMELCLDLNGMTLKQTTVGDRAMSAGDNCKLNLMDSVGTGTMIPASTSEDYSTKHAMFLWIRGDGAVVNLYSGTLDASACTAKYGCGLVVEIGTFNMYGGTIRGGTAYGSGSTTLAVDNGGEFNMYGGTLIGGYNQDTGFTSSVIHGGAVMRVGGVACIYGGEITGGKSDHNGGGIYIKGSGTLKILGGTVTGGECAGVGGGIFTEEGSTLILGGNANITGNKGTNVYLTQGAVLKIDADGLRGARIGISAETAGEFVTGTFTAEDAACFLSDDPAKTVIITDKGLALQG